MDVEEPASWPVEVETEEVEVEVVTELNSTEKTGSNTEPADEPQWCGGRGGAALANAAHGNQECDKVHSCYIDERNLA